jgi:tRNA dimethylallyltransferase
VAETPKIPIICGPTGSGKTAAALELAAHFPIEIVNADSRQIIRHLNIGTAKPTSEERRRAVFHLIDIIEPGDSYSAVRFVSDATRLIKEILARGNRPLVVGGTGLYLRALSEGIVEIETGDMAVRERLQAELDQLGPDKMHERLMEIDPLEAVKVHPNNTVRVLRALEIHTLTGKTKSELMATGVYRTSGFEFDYYALQPPRERLYATIDARVDMMIADGLVAEVKRLIAQELGEAVRRANVIGYNEILDHLEGRFALSEAVAMIKQNSRRYAKRQMTWFRHQADCAVFNEPGELIVSITKSYR